jgi:TRAP-type C4-dicarboxylate transport system permease small subunit
MTDEKDDASKSPEEKPSEPEPKSEPEKKEPVAPEERDEQEDPNVATPKSHVGASWVQPLVKFDAWWTTWEARLAAGVLGAEIFSLVTWIALKGMSAEYQPNQADPEAPIDISGIIFRALVGALVLGMATFFALRDKDPTKRKTDLRYQLGVSVAVILGMVASRFWANVGVSYFSNALNWLQSSSTLTLLGGLRGLATRFTLWLALLGASLATAQGKHINVDVVMRFLTPKMRLPVALIGWLAAAAVCLSGAWGFVDHLAIAEYKLSMDSPPGERVSKVEHEFGRDMFLLRQQIKLDLHSLPKVLAGAKYKDYLKAAEWNEWMNGGDWAAYFPAEDVKAQMMDATDTTSRLPLINIPGTGENTNGLLIRDIDFVFPFGLFMIALRFLLRCVLAIGGAVRVDPDAAHGEIEVENTQEKVAS